MMAETTENVVCETCDALIRENTLFCYNCGSKLDHVTPFEANGAVAVDENSKSALDDLTDKLSHGTASDNDLANAATERKKARVLHRRRNEFTWEPREDASVLAMVFSAFIAFVAIIVVILLVIWR